MGTEQNQFDIAIVGGGMVGASLAVSLEGAGYRAVMIEAGGFSQAPPASYDERAIALSYGSVEFLDRIAVWPQLAHDSAAIRRVHVSEQGALGVVRLQAERYGLDSLGHVVPASSLGRAFVRLLPELSDTRLMENTRVEGVRHFSDHIQLDLSGDQPSISAKLVIVADGVQSGLRSSLGIETEENDYGHTAVAFNLSASRAQDGTAYERFTNHGPLALLPFTEGRYGVVWTIDAEREAEVRDMQDADVLAELQATIGFRAGRLERLGKRGYYPLRRVRAREQVRPRICVLGNAAHALHPIGGQGFNLGLRDVMGLIQALHANPGDPGAPAVIQAYESSRLGDQDAVSGFTHALATLFGVPGDLPRHLRGAGLVLTEMLPPAKQWLAERAMGIGGPVPALGKSSLFNARAES
ncbi:MAG: 2-octaprenyl-6-methoxyphenyl hydroxylase [Gammaproteobacteria bacterium]